MKRRIKGLSSTASSGQSDVPDGVFLVRVDRAQYRWHQLKPFYVLRLTVIEPRELAGRVVSGRLYCTAKALWKLGWFLRDFPRRSRPALDRGSRREGPLPALRGVRHDQSHHNQRHFLAELSTASPPRSAVGRARPAPPPP